MKPPFKAAAPNARLTTDGRVYILLPSGEQQYLETAPPTGSVHGNAGFDDETAGVPDDWDFIWETGSPTVAAVTDPVYSGERALHVHLPAGGAEQVVLSDVFDVAPGGLVRFAFFAMKTLGSPVASLGVLTRDGGTPVFLEHPTSINNEAAAEALSAEWAMLERSAEVPRGHTKARLFVRVADGGGEECDVYVDLSSSQVLAPASVATDWQPLTYEPSWADTGFGWAPGEWRVHGDDLFLRGMATRSGTSSGSDAVIATIGADRMPANNSLVGGGYYLSSGIPSASQVYITPDGEIKTTVSVPASGSVPFDAGPIPLL